MKNTCFTLRRSSRYLLCKITSSLALILFFASLTFIPQNASAIVDLDADTLDDVWEERFNAQTVLPGDDEDGDGKTNLEECMAGTDPYDASDCLNLGNATITAGSGSVMLPTKAGKMYGLQIDNDLTGWTNEGTMIYGTGGDIQIDLSSTVDTGLTGSITHEVWVGPTGGNVTDLTSWADYPSQPLRHAGSAQPRDPRKRRQQLRRPHPRLHQAAHFRQLHLCHLQPRRQ